MKPCIDCVAEYQKAHDRWVHDHYLTPDLPQPKMSKRPANHPGPRCVTHHRVEKARADRAAHDRKVVRTYGLEPGEYWLLYEFQGNHCGICGRANGTVKRLAVDHDHKTGLPRGLLCGPCNQFLGHGRDDPEFFRRIIDYLTKPPYERMKHGLPGAASGRDVGDQPASDVDDPHPRPVSAPVLFAWPE